MGTYDGWHRRCGAPRALGATPCSAYGKRIYGGRCYVHRHLAEVPPPPPRSSPVQCAATNRDHTRCNNNAAEGKALCAVHLRIPPHEPRASHRCGHVDALGYTCRRRVAREGERCMWHDPARPRCHAISSSGTRCSQLSKRGQNYCGDHMRRDARTRELEAEAGALRARVRELERRLADLTRPDVDEAAS